MGLRIRNKDAHSFGKWSAGKRPLAHPGVGFVEEKMIGSLHPQYVVDAEGNQQSVILPIAEYEELLECVQDVIDIEEVDRRRDDPLHHWSDVKADRENLKRA